METKVTRSGEHEENDEDIKEFMGLNPAQSAQSAQPMHLPPLQLSQVIKNPVRSPTNMCPPAPRGSATPESPVSPVKSPAVKEIVSMPRPHKRHKWVTIESRYSGNPVQTIQNYQRAVLAYKFEAEQGNMPFASHITYPQWVMCGVNSFAGDPGSELLHRIFGHWGGFRQILGRKKCIQQSDDVRRQCDEMHVYGDDWKKSKGVRDAVQLAKKHMIPVTHCKLPPELERQIFGKSVLSTVVPVVRMLGSVAGLVSLGFVTTRHGPSLIRSAAFFARKLFFKTR
ncbi:hypothetical protein OAM67_01755 [bacterium]|nr:hypothetical protein [bacterium]